VPFRRVYIPNDQQRVVIQALTVGHSLRTSMRLAGYKAWEGASYSLLFGHSPRFRHWARDNVYDRLPPRARAALERYDD
jgi:hypothetical protein